MPEIDAVLSYHMDPHTCGVARFNHELAKRLGVPCESLEYNDNEQRHVLVSIKPSEMPSVTSFRARSFDLLLHDRTLDGTDSCAKWATRVLYADEVGCPATIHANPSRSGPRVLTFGMAHKVQIARLEKLRALLDTGGDYSVNVSCAVHEGQSWERTLHETMADAREVFGAHARLLGYLADDALDEEIRRANAVAVFFDPAARANNTSLWAAMERGTAVVTNLDAQSPPELQHDVNCFDIDQLTEWPTPDRMRAIRGAASAVAERYSWDRLLEILRA